VKLLLQNSCRSSCGFHTDAYALSVRILLLEDDPAIGATLLESLRDSGYVVDQAFTALQAKGLIQAFEFDAMIVDVRLPDGPDAGFRLVENLRANAILCPVLFLTARDTLEDRVLGLDAGGDDYLIKPFALPEVHARLRALLRRARPVPTNLLERGDFSLDWAAQRVTVASQSVHLTAKEYGILELLASHPGRVFNRDEIADRVWGSEFDADSRVVDVYVKNLRRKIGAWVIETLVGSGYRFPSL
jgi:DNA-binding response OmpR family regulator